MKNDQILAQITEFCRRSDMAESTFGRRAVNDGKLVSRLREGKRITTDTLERIQAYIAASTPDGLPPVRGLEVVAEKRDPRGNCRFFENRQKYLLFVHTCSEKRVIADRGYDSKRHRQQLWQRGIKPVIARRQTTHGSGLGRDRWVIEDDTFRELKEGWGLERAQWGTQSNTVHGRVTLTLLAFNTAQLYRTQGGQRLADTGIRRLRQLHQRDLGAAPVVLYRDGCYGVFALEDVLALLGAPVQQSLRPNPRPARPPTAGP